MTSFWPTIARPYSASHAYRRHPSVAGVLNVPGHVKCGVSTHRPHTAEDPGRLFYGRTRVTVVIAILTSLGCDEIIIRSSRPG